MSNAKRPAARKSTARTEAKRDTELDSGIRITMEGESYEVRVGDVTSTLARELRRVSGISFQQLLNEVANEPDIDAIATFVWLARRMAGEKVDIDDVVITYAQLLEDFDVAIAGERQVGDDPEA